MWKCLYVYFPVLVLRAIGGWPGVAIIELCSLLVLPGGDSVRDLGEDFILKKCLKYKKNCSVDEENKKQ